ncbi:MAG: hypothetical protein IKT80_06720 [Bacteroidaceae bacterium]|nr:hypothetical protein [Bacteroidaceae bacterium]
MGVREIGIIDDYFVAATTNPAGQIRIFNKNTFQELAILCPEGRARADLMHPYLQPLQLVKKDSIPTLLIIDNNSVTKLINLKESITAGYAVVDTIIRAICDPVNGYSLYVGNDKWLDYHGVYYDDPRDNICTVPTFIVRNKNGKQEIPLFGDIKKMEATPWTNAYYTGQALARPSGGQVVFVMYVLDYFNIFNTDSMTVKTIHNSNSVTIDQPTGINDVRNSPICYTSVSATDNLILTTTWDYSYNQNADIPISKDYVRIWNWEGDLVARFYMDHCLTSVAYDEENMILYGLDSGDEKIYSYDISPYLSIDK